MLNKHSGAYTLSWGCRIVKKDKQRSALPVLVVAMAIIAAVFAFGPTDFDNNTNAKNMTPYRAERFVLPDMRVVENVLPKLFKNPSGSSGGKEAATVKINLRNDTNFDIDVQQLLDKGVRVPLNEEGVQVVIVHTHGTEAYTPHGSDTYKESDDLRTLDQTQNVLRVGEELKNALQEKGIKTVHCTELCDYPQYNGAYDRSREAIEKMLRLYPEAQIVIDLHRDAVATAEGGYYKATAQIDGIDAAQLLFVVGTDGGGLTHPDWRDNMSFQLRLHERIEQMYPGLMRPINVRAARFNQHFRTGSMLLEVGTCANYLQEALYSVRLFADALADVLKNG